MARFISLFAAAGVLVPLIFQVIWLVVDSYPSIGRNIGYGLHKITLVFFPSSFVMMAASEESLYLGLLFIAIAVNVVLYVIIGVAIWYGFKKHYVILVLLAAVLSVMWWRIITL
ncbi:MAG: hypothetical protein KZQ87_05890 [Candidatus Thiodiazotropha sp. (ex Cardiolucina cf. quadrata)]|nr:hypothetical protein [Candidatus Thiodiazotropha sp. (ex Cardiolucina cf. quadrata)]